MLTCFIRMIEHILFLKMGIYSPCKGKGKTYSIHTMYLFKCKNIHLYVYILTCIEKNTAIKSLNLGGIVDNYFILILFYIFSLFYFFIFFKFSLFYRCTESIYSFIRKSYLHLQRKIGSTEGRVKY